MLMVRRRYAPAPRAWCLPAGFMEYGETPRRCARASCSKRLGIAARLTGLFGVYAGLDDPRERAILILYTGVRTGGRLKPGDDALEAKFFPLDAAASQDCVRFTSRGARGGARARNDFVSSGLARSVASRRLRPGCGLARRVLGAERHRHDRPGEDRAVRSRSFERLSVPLVAQVEHAAQPVL